MYFSLAGMFKSSIKMIILYFLSSGPKRLALLLVFILVSIDL